MQALGFIEYQKTAKFAKYAKCKPRQVCFNEFDGSILIVDRRKRPPRVAIIDHSDREAPIFKSTDDHHITGARLKRRIEAAVLAFAHRHKVKALHMGCGGFVMTPRLFHPEPTKRYAVPATLPGATTTFRKLTPTEVNSAVNTLHKIFKLEQPRTVYLFAPHDVSAMTAERLSQPTIKLYDNLWMRKSGDEAEYRITTARAAALYSPESAVVYYGEMKGAWLEREHKAKHAAFLDSFYRDVFALLKTRGLKHVHIAVEDTCRFHKLTGITNGVTIPVPAP